MPPIRPRMKMTTRKMILSPSREIAGEDGDDDEEAAAAAAADVGSSSCEKIAREVVVGVSPSPP